MGVLFYCIAILLYLPLTAINLFIIMIKCFSFKNFNRYFYETSLDLDRFGNRNFRTLFNKYLIKKDGYQFGDQRETISSVLGKNQLNGSLLYSGKFLVFILDTLDENHCIKLINHIK